MKTRTMLDTKWKANAAIRLYKEYGFPTNNTRNKRARMRQAQRRKYLHTEKAEKDRLERLRVYFEKLEKQKDAK